MCGPEEALTSSLAPFVVAAAACSPEAAGSLAEFEVDAVVAALYLGILAGTVEGHQAGVEDTHAGCLDEPEPEAEGWEQFWDLAGTPEAAAGRWVEETDALAAEASAAGIQGLGRECERESLAEERSWDRPQSAEVGHSQLRLQVEQGAVVWERSWRREPGWCRWWLSTA